MENRKEFNDFTRIRYDKKIIRGIIVFLAINVFVAVAGSIFVSNYWNPYTSLLVRYLTDTIMMITVLSYVDLLVFSSVLIEGLWYLWKLKKMGYTIPEERKLYQNDLRKVPRLLPEEEIKVKPIRSVVCAILCAAGFIMCTICDVKLIIEWSFLGNELLLLLPGSILNCVWLYLVFYFARQLNQKKYREDYEINDSRVERTSILLAVVIVIPLFVFTTVSKEVSEAIFHKMYYSRKEHDEAQLEDIGNVLMNIYLYRTEDPTFEESNKRIYEVFEQGFIITDFGEPQNSYLKEVANCLDIDSFDEMSGLIYLSEGDAKIHIIVKGDKLVVTLMNPIEKDKEDGVKAEFYWIF